MNCKPHMYNLTLFKSKGWNTSEALSLSRNNRLSRDDFTIKTDITGLSHAIVELKL